MNLRPSESAALAEIERSKKNDQLLKKGANLAVSAGTAALGVGAASKILPFLNEYIPIDLAIKGISKVNPKIGEFLKKGQSMGLDIKQGLDFIKGQFEGEKEPHEKVEEPAKKGNPLQDFETNYPDLAQGLMNTIQNGQSPEAAAGILKTSTALGKQVKKLEKEIGMNFVDYVLQLFGPQGGGMQQQQQPQQQQQMGAQPQQQGQPQAQGGNVDQELMAALDKILKM